MYRQSAFLSNSRLLAISLLVVAAVLAVVVSPRDTFAANTIVTKQYLDTNTNKTVETIRWTMDENVTACTYEAGDWTVNTAGSINVAITGLSCAGNDAILNITVTADANETGGATAPVISYANQGTTGSVTLTSGAMTAKASQSITDGAAPIIHSVTTEDTDTNGLIDKLTYTWTEFIDTNDSAVPVAADLPTTLLPDGSTATFGSATISDPAAASAVVTVTGVTGQAAVNTAAGSTAISGNLAALWVDAATNAPHATAATGNETVVDSAAPITVSVSPADDATGVDRGANIIMNFSEAMDTGSLTFATDPALTYNAAWSNSDKTVTLSQTGVLFDQGTTYTATASAANAAAGTSVALVGLPYSWGFIAQEGSGGGGGGSSYSKKKDTTKDDDTSADDASDASDLMAMVTKLQAELNAMIAGGSVTTTATATADADLDIGSEGAAVTALQAWLIGKGYAIAAGATGYFGAQTQAALAAYQAAVGISPAAGYYGPKTRAYIAANP